MNKILTFLLFLSLVLINSLAVFADDDWYGKYDHDRDGRWDYDDFNRWQADRGYYGRHLSDKQRRRMYMRYDRDRDGYWTREEAYRYHH